MPLRKADLTATKKFEDGDAWLVLRTQLTKGEGDTVRDLTAGYRLEQGNTPDEMQVEISNRVADANRALFEILCVEWSLGEVSGQAYADLDNESGQWVDECIQEVLRERRARAEKNSPSSKKPRARASSSRRAAA